MRAYPGASFRLTPRHWYGIILLLIVAGGLYLTIPPILVQRDIDAQLARIAELEEPFYTWDPQHPKGAHKAFELPQSADNEQGLNITNALGAFGATFPFQNWETGFTLPDRRWYPRVALREIEAHGRLGEKAASQFAASNAVSFNILQPLLIERDDLFLDKHIEVFDFYPTWEVFSMAVECLNVAYLEATTRGDTEAAVTHLLQRQTFLRNMELIQDFQFHIYYVYYKELPDLQPLLSRCQPDNDQLTRIRNALRLPTRDNLLLQLYYDRQQHHDYLMDRIHNIPGLYYLVPAAAIVPRPIFSGIEDLARRPFGRRIWSFNRLCILRYYRNAIDTINATRNVLDLPPAFLQLARDHSQHGKNAFYTNDLLRRTIATASDDTIMKFLGRLQHYHLHLVALDLEIHRNNTGKYPASLDDVELPDESLGFLREFQGLAYANTGNGFSLSDNSTPPVVLFRINRPANK